MAKSPLETAYDNLDTQFRNDEIGFNEYKESYQALKDASDDWGITTFGKSAARQVAKTIPSAMSGIGGTFGLEGLESKGREWESDIDQAIKVDPNQEDDFLTAKLGSGFGSLLGIAATGGGVGLGTKGLLAGASKFANLTNKTKGLVTRAATQGAGLTTGAGLGASEGIRDYEATQAEKGLPVDPNRKQEVGAWNMPVGILDWVIPGKILGDASKAFGKTPADIIKAIKEGKPLIKPVAKKEIAKGAIEGAAIEGGTEAAQQAALNAIAKSKYDAERIITEGVGEAAAIGAITGGAVKGSLGYMQAKGLQKKHDIADGILQKEFEEAKKSATGVHEDYINSTVKSEKERLDGVIPDTEAEYLAQFPQEQQEQAKNIYSKFTPEDKLLSKELKKFDPTMSKADYIRNHDEFSDIINKYAPEQEQYVDKDNVVKTRDAKLTKEQKDSKQAELIEKNNELEARWEKLSNATLDQAQEKVVRDEDLVTAPVDVEATDIDAIQREEESQNVMYGNMQDERNIDNALGGVQVEELDKTAKEGIQTDIMSDDVAMAVANALPQMKKGVQGTKKFLNRAIGIRQDIANGANKRLTSNQRKALEVYDEVSQQPIDPNQADPQYSLYRGLKKEGNPRGYPGTFMTRDGNLARRYARKDGTVVRTEDEPKNTLSVDAIQKWPVAKKSKLLKEFTAFMKNRYPNVPEKVLIGKEQESYAYLDQVLGEPNETDFIYPTQDDVDFLRSKGYDSVSFNNEGGEVVDTVFLFDEPNLSKDYNYSLSRDNMDRNDPDTDTIASMAAEAVKRERLMKKNGVGLEIVFITEPSQIPNRIVNDLKEGETPKAVLWNSKVYVFPNNIKNRSEMRQKIVHEVTGHYGIEKLWGNNKKGLEAFLDKLYPVMHDKDIVAGIKSNYGDRVDVNTVEGRRTLVKEYIAHLSETEYQNDPGFVKRLIALAKHVLRKWGIVDISDSDVKALISEAYQRTQGSGLTAYQEQVAKSKDSLDMKEKQEASLPLDSTDSEIYADYGIDNIGYKDNIRSPGSTSVVEDYEGGEDYPYSVYLGDNYFRSYKTKEGAEELANSVPDYSKTHIYSSEDPTLKDGFESVHFGIEELEDKEVAHARVLDKDGNRYVVENQSDRLQHGYNKPDRQKYDAAVKAIKTYTPIVEAVEKHLNNNTVPEKTLSTLSTEPTDEQRLEYSVYKMFYINENELQDRKVTIRMLEQLKLQLADRQSIVDTWNDGGKPKPSKLKAIEPNINKILIMEELKRANREDMNSLNIPHEDTVSKVEGWQDYKELKPNINLSDYIFKTEYAEIDGDDVDETHTQHGISSEAINTYSQWKNTKYRKKGNDNEWRPAIELVDSVYNERDTALRNKYKRVNEWAQNDLGAMPYTDDKGNKWYRIDLQENDGVTAVDIAYSNAVEKAVDPVDEAIAPPVYSMSKKKYKKFLKKKKKKSKDRPININHLKDEDLQKAEVKRKQNAWERFYDGVLVESLEGKAPKTVKAMRDLMGWVDGNLSNIRHKSYFEALRARTLGSVSKSQDFSNYVARLSDKYSDEQRHEIGLWITGKGNRPAFIDSEDEASLEKGRELITEYAQELVDLDKLDKEIFEANKAHYLPVIYTDYFIHSLGTGKKLSPEEYLKARKFKDNSIETEVRKALKGEITDPFVKMAVAISQIGRDAALGKFYDGLQNYHALAMPRSWGTLKDSEGVTTETLKMVHTLDKFGMIDGDIPNLKVTGKKYKADPNVETKAHETLKKDKALLLKHLRNNTKLTKDSTSDKALLQELRDKYVIAKGKRYGSLDGLIIRKEIKDDIDEAINPLHDENAQVWNEISKYYNYWKMGKVPLNVTSQFRNIIGNFLLLDMGTTTNSGILLADTAGMFKSFYASGTKQKDIEAYKQEFDLNDLDQIARYITREMGGGATAFSTAELQAKKHEILNVINDFEKASKLKSLARQMRLYNVLVKYKDFMMDNYQMMEQVFKAVAVKDYLRQVARQNGNADSVAYFTMLQGKDREAFMGNAIAHANKSIFDYSRVNPLVNKARRSPIGLPFITFNLKAMPATVDAMIYRPQKMIKYAVLPYLLTQAASSMGDFDEDEVEEAIANQPEWMQKKSNVWMSPWKDQDGRVVWVDMDYLVPFGAMTNGLKTLWSLNESEGVADSILNTGEAVLTAGGITSSPLWSLVSAMGTGIDTFSGREIMPSGATPLDKLQGVINYVYNFAVPSMAATSGPLNELFSSMDMADSLDSRTGKEKRNALQDVIKMGGINTYAVDPQEQRRMNRKMKLYEIKEAQTRKMHELRNANNANDRQEIITSYNAYIANLRAKMKQ